MELMKQILTGIDRTLIKKWVKEKSRARRLSDSSREHFRHGAIQQIAALPIPGAEA